MGSPRNVAVLVFDDVEVLDFCGPFEVFSVTGRREDLDLFHAYTVAERPAAVAARGGLAVLPAYTLADAPPADVLVIPGGFGTRREMNNAALVAWVRDAAARAELVLSVCTGALILARAGLLDGLQATTHHGALDLLESVAPETRVRRDRRIVDNGRIVVSAGISAGIDAALHVVAKLHGRDRALETARYMEYDWSA
ncbi:MAG TPA: DJ-1/PfpI family protein, partial [Longimicrobiales bacterium]|nr:DJ-1/PfpI family protein [Longimicrobiales bacterium]